MMASCFGLRSLFPGAPSEMSHRRGQGFDEALIDPVRAHTLYRQRGGWGARQDG